MLEIPNLVLFKVAAISVSSSQYSGLTIQYSIIYLNIQRFIC